MAGAFETNKLVFERGDVVDFYASQSKLQPAEAAVFRRLEAGLGAMRMLDVGVGGGRTTVHFAPRVKDYVGVDYAPAMVDAVRVRFAGARYRFEVADARALVHEDASFDLALFSYNGIDYMTDDDRSRAIGELRRVLAPGGMLCFSTHNLQRARELLHGVDGEGVFRRLAKSSARRRLRRLNPPLADLDGRDHAMLNDGAFKDALVTYHVRPKAQRARLALAGFSKVVVLSSVDGSELDDAAQARTTEPWLYFCATV